MPAGGGGCTGKSESRFGEKKKGGFGERNKEKRRRRGIGPGGAGGGCLD